MRRIIITTGCESSGKSSLAFDLSQSLGLPLVPEIARDYLNARLWDNPAFHYGQNDLLEIARRQHALESCMQDEDPQGLVCDTDLLVLMIWSEVKYGSCHPWIRDTLREQIRSGPPRHYLLCDWNIPWVPDPLRENPHDRDALFARYRDRLEDFGVDHTLVRGPRPDRLAQSLDRLGLEDTLVNPSLLV